MMKISSSQALVLRMAFPCKVYLDRELDSLPSSGVFLFQVASSDVQHKRGRRKTNFALIILHTGKRAKYVRIGCCSIAPKELKRFWLASEWHWRSWFRRLQTLQESVFEPGDIGRASYQDYDGKQGFTIAIA
jgi:hypothetical protein